MNQLKLFFLAFLVLAPAVSARPYTETSGRLEIDWAAHRIRFFGQSRLPENTPPETSYRTVEKAAWQEGLNYVNRAVRELHVSAYEGQVANPQRLSSDAKKAASAIATSTYSRNTVYYADGTVRVMLENLLVRALASPRLRFRQKEAVTSSGRYSGVVFKLDKAIKARPIYQVVDETGALLFNEGDMAEQAYEKNLMGRWFISPTPHELTQAIGKEPLEIRAKVDENGRFVVLRKEWQEAVSGYRSLLVAGAIAIALPEKL